MRIAKDLVERKQPSGIRQHAQQMRLILPMLVLERPPSKTASRLMNPGSGALHPSKTASRAGARSAGAGVEGKRRIWPSARAESHSTACAAKFLANQENRTWLLFRLFAPNVRFVCALRLGLHSHQWSKNNLICWIDERNFHATLGTPDKTKSKIIHCAI